MNRPVSDHRTLGLSRTDWAAPTLPDHPVGSTRARLVAPGRCAGSVARRLPGRVQLPADIRPHDALDPQ